MKSNEAQYFQTKLTSVENIDAELRRWALAQTFHEFLPAVSVGEQTEILVLPKQRSVRRHFFEINRGGLMASPVHVKV
jgi:hypothetical protein